MHFEAIRDFEWLNEPEFCFDSGGLAIKAAPETDFWRDRCRNVCKDNGHFFYARRGGAFALDVVWLVPPARSKAGFCGLMARVDADNWCKAVWGRKPDGRPFVVVSVTHFGCSDLAEFPLVSESPRITFRLQVQDGILRLSFSADGRRFVPVRQFRLLADYDVLSVGACIYGSDSAGFKAVLADVDFAAVTDR